MLPWKNSKQTENGVQTGENGVSRPRRRGLLAMTLGGFGSFIGSSTAGAVGGKVSEGEKTEATEQYRDVRVIKSIFKQHESLLKTLESEGILEDSSVAELDFVLRDSIRPERNKHGVFVSARRVNGEVISKIGMVRYSSSGILQIGVYPEQNHIYAVFSPHGQESSTKFFGDGPITAALTDGPKSDLTMSDCWDDCCNSYCPNACVEPCYCECYSGSCCGCSTC